MNEKPFSEREREHYRQMVALIIDGDPEAKRKLDNLARVQLAAVRQTLPDADNETIVTFLASMAFIMARLMATPFGEVSEMVHAVFNNNVTAAAHAMGAYNLDDPDDIPASSGETKPGPPRAQSDLLTGMYL